MNTAATFREFAAEISGLAGLSDRAVVMVVLHHGRVNGVAQMTRSEIQGAISEAGLGTQATGKMLRRLCEPPNESLVRLDGKFGLSLFGEREVREFIRERVPQSEEARRVVARLPPDRRPLFEEAVNCIEGGIRRAAVVMVWLGAMRHLRGYVLTSRLQAFNAALKARNDFMGQLVIASDDDFDDLKKESNFILILAAANIVTNDERKLLETSLGFRNTAAHPNGVALSRSRAISMLEDIVENLVLKYPV